MTRAESPPRYTRGTRGDRAAARRVSDTKSGDASSAHCDEIAAHEDDLAFELGGQIVGGEYALVDSPARTIPEYALFPARLRITAVPTRCDGDELARDASRLGHESLALRLLEMAVEVTGEDAVERSVLERQRERLAMDE